MYVFGLDERCVHKIKNIFVISTFTFLMGVLSFFLMLIWFMLVDLLWLKCRKGVYKSAYSVYICIGSGSDDKTLQDAVNGKNYNHHAPEYVPEPGLLAIMQH